MFTPQEAPIPPDSRFTLEAGSLIYRVQLTVALPVTVNLAGLLLAPPNTMRNRFDLGVEPVAYFATTKLAALVESAFRRENEYQSRAYLADRSLVTIKVQQDLDLVDLRGLERTFPFLISGRYRVCQAYAWQWRADGFNGVIYASAQHPGQTCIALFEPGIRDTKVVRKESLMIKGKPTPLVEQASYLTQIPLA